MESKDSNVFRVNVRCVHGDETITTILFTCFGHDTISTLKKLIENQTGFSHGKQFIVVNKRVASDEQLLKEIGIEAGSTIHMVYKGDKRKPRMCHIIGRKMNSHSESTDVKINLNKTTVLDLKNMIAKKFGCMDEVKIILKGKKLKDNVLLDDVKITNYPFFNYILPWR